MLMHFYEKPEFMQDIGAVDETTIPIRRPTIDFTCDFINHKRNYSLTARLLLNILIYFLL